MNMRQLEKLLLIAMITALVLWAVNAVAGERQIGLIKKSHAKYDAPEAAFSAFISAQMAGDLVWHYETMTMESAEEERRTFATNAIVPVAGMEVFRKGYVESCIANQFNYADAVVLVVRIKDVAGDISILPYTLVLEDGKWKVTNKYAASEELLQYVGFEPKLFFGHGQRPDDVNAFLGYHYPQQSTTELPAGTATFDLHIFYGETIDSATFSAELDGEDITRLFIPAPNSDQMVTLDLKQGRNVLLLSVAGKRADGKNAKDADRLVFVVP